MLSDVFKDNCLAVSILDCIYRDILSVCFDGKMCLADFETLQIIGING